MGKINTHGLKIKGLKAAAGDTFPCDRDAYTEIFYNLSSGEIWAVYHASRNTWTEYHDPDVVRVCGTSQRMTMQAISDRVAEAVEQREALDRQTAESRI